MNALELYHTHLATTGDPVAAALLTHAEIVQRDTLKPQDIADQLAVSPATVIEWIRSGQLKAANIAKGQKPRFIIKRVDLDRFLDSRQIEPPRETGYTPQPKSGKRY